MIPQEKRDAVARGLYDAFGVTRFEHIDRLTKGLSSALVFRIVVRARQYLLRVITRTDALNDPTRQFACMNAAAEAGLAPRVWYISIEDRISITDFVEATPFAQAEALALIPRALRTLHALPRFAPMSLYPHYLDAVDGFVRRFGAARILPESETRELLTRYAQVAAVYPRHHAEMVSSHNDLKPENILFDGRRVWLVDWESAFLNDRYHDLAVVANFVVDSDLDERDYLREYFGQAPDEYQLARFFLMRQIAHVAYAVMFLLLGSSGKPLDITGNAPEFRDFHRRIWAGAVDLADNAMQVAYGRAHLRQLSNNLRTPRLKDAMRTVSDGDARGSNPGACGARLSGD